jgi:hypothetical protein
MESILGVVAIYQRAPNQKWQAVPVTESVAGGMGNHFSENTAWGFYISHSALDVPHWFLVLATIGLSALPWLRLRFSLRTLLIATTLVAVVLGLVVWASR